MSNFRRRLMMALNKKENFDDFQEVEYIGSTGYQYIDTEIKPTNLTKVEISFMQSSQTGYLYGSRTSSSSNDAHAFILHYGSIYPQFDGQQSKVSSSYNKTGIKYILKNSQDGAYINDDLTKSYTESSFSSDYSMYLFALNQSNSVESRTLKGRIYYCKIFEDGILVRRFVPCYRKSNGEIGMYDLVNNVFYTNKGSGTFTKGSDVVTKWFDYEDFYNNYVIAINNKNIGIYVIKLEPNTSYKVSTNLEANGFSKVFVVSGSNTSWSPSTGNNGVMPAKPRTITTDSEGNMCIGIYVAGSNIVNKSEFLNGTAWVKIEKVDN